MASTTIDIVFNFIKQGADLSAEFSKLKQEASSTVNEFKQALSIEKMSQSVHREINKVIETCSEKIEKTIENSIIKIDSIADQAFKRIESKINNVIREVTGRGLKGVKDIEDGVERAINIFSSFGFATIFVLLKYWSGGILGLHENFKDMLIRDYIQAEEVLKSLIDYLSGGVKQLLQIPKDFNKIFTKVGWAWNHEMLLKIKVLLQETKNIFIQIIIPFTQHFIGNILFLFPMIKSAGRDFIGFFKFIAGKSEAKLTPLQHGLQLVQTLNKSLMTTKAIVKEVFKIGSYSILMWKNLLNPFMGQFAIIFNLSKIVRNLMTETILSFKARVGNVGAKIQIAIIRIRDALYALSARGFNKTSTIEKITNGLIVISNILSLIANVIIPRLITYIKTNFSALYIQFRQVIEPLLSLSEKLKMKFSGFLSGFLSSLPFIGGFFKKETTSIEQIVFLLLEKIRIKIEQLLETVILKVYQTVSKVKEASRNILPTMEAGGKLNTKETEPKSIKNVALKDFQITIKNLQNDIKNLESHILNLVSQNNFLSRSFTTLQTRIQETYTTIQSFFSSIGRGVSETAYEQKLKSLETVTNNFTLSTQENFTKFNDALNNAFVTLQENFSNIEQQVKGLIESNSQLEKSFAKIQKSFLKKEKKKETETEPKSIKNVALENLQNFIKVLQNDIKNLESHILNLVSQNNFLSQSFKALQEEINVTSGSMQNFYATTGTDNAISQIHRPFQVVTQTVHSTIDSFKNASEGFQNLHGTILNLSSEMVDNGITPFKNSIQGIGSAFQEIQEKATENFNVIKNAIKTLGLDELLQTLQALGVDTFKNVKTEAGLGIVAGRKEKKETRKSLFNVFKNIQASPQELSEIRGSIQQLFNNVFKTDKLFNVSLLKKQLFENFDKSFVNLDSYIKDSIAGKVKPHVFVKNLFSQKELKKELKDFFKNVFANADLKDIGKNFKDSPDFQQIFLKQFKGKEKETGLRIVQQLMQGIALGEKDVRRTIKSLTNTIMDYFPRSPAKIGPLRLLSYVGGKIPIQLMDGMQQQTNKLSQFIDKMLDSYIVGPIRKATDLARTALRLNVDVEQLSVLDIALARTGTSIQDISYSISSMQEKINGLIEPEDFIKLERFGINIHAIRESTNPLLELFLAISDAIKKVGMTPEMEELLASFSIFKTSNFVNFLSLGRAEITKIVKELTKSNIALDDTFSKTSEKLDGTISQIKNIKDVFFQSIYKPVVPIWLKFCETVKQYLLDYSQEIQIVGEMAGVMVSFATGIFTSFIKGLLTDTKQTLNAMFEMIKTFFKFVFQTGVSLLISAFNTIPFDEFYDKITNFFKTLIKNNFISVIVAIPSYVRLLSGLIQYHVIKMWATFFKTIADFIDNFFTKSLSSSNEIGNKIGNIASKTKEELTKNVTDFANESKEKVTSVVKDAKNATNNFVKYTREKVEDQGASLLNKVSSFFELLYDTVTGKLSPENIQRAIGNIFSKLNPFRWIANFFGFLEDKFAIEISTLYESLNNTLNTLSKESKEAFSDIFNLNIDEKQAKSLTENLQEQLQVFIKNLKENTKGTVFEDNFNSFLTNFESIKSRFKELNYNKINDNVKIQIEKTIEQVEQATEKIKKNIDGTLLEIEKVSLTKIKSLTDFLLKGFNESTKSLSNSSSYVLLKIKNTISATKLEMYKAIEDLKKMGASEQELNQAKETSNFVLRNNIVNDLKDAISPFTEGGEKNIYALFDVSGLRQKTDQIINEFKEMGSALGMTVEEIAVTVTEMEKEVSDSIVKMTREAFDATSNILKEATSSLSGAMSDMYEASGQKIKGFFYANKSIAIAESIINTAQAATKALATYPPPLNAAMAGIVIASGAAQTAKIVATTVQGPTHYASGGKVRGAGGIDNIPAMLTAGEFVQPVSVVAQYGADFMEALRQRIIPVQQIRNIMSNIHNVSNAYTPQAQRYFTGGIARQTSSENIQNSINIVNYLDYREMNRYLSSSEGQKAFLNMMNSNRNQIKRILT